MKGNVVDLAVGVITGAAFGKIVGKLSGGLDFSNCVILLWAAAGHVQGAIDLRSAELQAVQ